MEDRWFGNEFQILGATDGNDLEAAMVVVRGGTHIEKDEELRKKSGVLAPAHQYMGVEGKNSLQIYRPVLCWPSVLLSKLSVDELQETYDSTLVALVDHHAPIRRRHQPTTTWFYSECDVAKRKKLECDVI